MRRLLHTILIGSAATLTAWAGDTTYLLARELMEEEQYPLAAVEFRRMATETPDPAEQAAAYLYAGHSYLKARQSEFAGEMLDLAESADADAEYTREIALLNAENAYAKGELDTALYYYDLLADDEDAEGGHRYALRRAASIHLRQGNPDGARQRLSELPDDASRSMAALDRYTDGRDKKPLVGGLLGILPGMGYWYSGEIANGFRSMILNGLFIYGMVDTAEDDQWGAFAIITFFELTWYSGSIYGGVDAAHRYNRERLDTAVQGIERDMTYAPESGITLPIFKLNFEF